MSSYIAPLPPPPPIFRIPVIHLLQWAIDAALLVCF